MINEKGEISYTQLDALIKLQYKINELELFNRTLKRDFEAYLATVAEEFEGVEIKLKDGKE